jgi:hypothetical protein
MTTAPPTSDNPQPNPQDSSPRPWQSGWPVAGALVSLATFVVGIVIGVFFISSSNVGSPNDASACSYFWQFQAAPNIPTLVQLAIRSNPGNDLGSHFLGEWLNTFYQQVNSPPITAPQLLSDSKNGTALGISSICQQLGYNPPVG